MKKLSTLVLGLCLSGTTLAYQEPKIVYGEDNRQEPFEALSSLSVLSKSTAAMIEKKDIIIPSTWAQLTGDNSVSFKAVSLKNTYRLCEGEKFAHQPTTANCSGFLVTPQLLVTAGHCIATQEECEQNSWVFDYKVSSYSQTSVKVTADKVFNCKKLMKRKLDPTTDTDFAVIQLDRPVPGRTPFKIAKSKNMIGTPIAMMGHPSGLPLKITDGAMILGLQKNSYRTDLDAFGGNSGSVVVNANTKEVIGILVRGQKDYVDSVKGCRMVNKLPSSRGGESVSFISQIFF